MARFINVLNSCTQFIRYKDADYQNHLCDKKHFYDRKYSQNRGVITLEFILFVVMKAIRKALLFFMHLFSRIVAEAS